MWNMIVCGNLAELTVEIYSSGGHAADQEVAGVEQTQPRTQLNKPGDCYLNYRPSLKIATAKRII